MTKLMYLLRKENGFFFLISVRFFSIALLNTAINEFQIICTKAVLPRPVGFLPRRFWSLLSAFGKRILKLQVVVLTEVAVKSSYNL